MDKLIKAIKNSGEVIDALTEVLLKLGTLLAIIKMIVDNLN